MELRRMPRMSRVRSLAACSIVGLILTSTAATAGAVPSVAGDARDTVSPVVQAVSPARFVVGSAVRGTDFLETDNPHYLDADAKISWRARDNWGGSGVCDVEVYRQPDDDPELYMPGLPRRGSVIDPDNTNYDGSEGGGSATTRGWWVKAYDCAGNSSAVWVGGRLEVVQEDGSHVGPAVTVSYTGAWQTTSCPDCLVAAAAQTSDRGASATIDVPGGSAVALVLRTGPDYGRAKILVNGKRRGRVNTRARQAQDGVIVWTRRLRKTDMTISVVPQTRRGRTATIALDAFLYRTPENPSDYPAP